MSASYQNANKMPKADIKIVLWPQYPNSNTYAHTHIHTHAGTPTYAQTQMDTYKAMGSSMGVFDALCDIACKKGYTNKFWFD